MSHCEEIMKPTLMYPQLHVFIVSRLKTARCWLMSKHRGVSGAGGSKRPNNCRGIRLPGLTCTICTSLDMDTVWMLTPRGWKAKWRKDLSAVHTMDIHHTEPLHFHSHRVTVTLSSWRLDCPSSVQNQGKCAFEIPTSPRLFCPIILSSVCQIIQKAWSK